MNVSEVNALMDPPPTAIVVDLDETLVRADIFREQAARYLLSSPVAPLRLFAVAFKGRAALKAFLAARVPVDAENLPFRADLVEWLAAQRRGGRRILLATAADESVARRVAAQAGVFDDLVATTPGANLKGARKLSAVRGRLGGDGFIFIGDNRSDRCLWEACGRGILVNPSRRMRGWARRTGLRHSVISDRENRPLAILRLLRPAQWSKNLLVFVPLLTSHRLFEPRVLEAGVLTFLAFCAAASAGYILNDLVDLQSDRAHPRKKNRPLAAGRLDMFYAFALPPALLAVAVGCQSETAPGALRFLAGYVLLTLTYSLWARRRIALDVAWLAGLYTIRIFAGGAAAGIGISVWLALFAAALFASLALLKRFAELRNWLVDGRHARRPYSERDIARVRIAGLGASAASVLVYAAYILSGETGYPYAHPERLWLGIPLLVGWAARVWRRASAGRLGSELVQSLLSDPVSYLVIAGFAAVSFWAS